MISRFLYAILVSCVCVAPLSSQTLPETSPDAVGISSERLQRLADAIDREIRDGRTPGAVVAIARRGKLAYFESFGFLDREAGLPMPRDAVFSIASMTKPIVAVGALKLLEEGRLLLNEPVASYLPELTNPTVAIDGDPSRTIPAIREPTVRDLMRHTSGHPGTGETRLHQLYPGPPVNTNLSGHELVELLGNLPLLHQPGTVWDYSYGFDLLGIIIERTSGETLGDYLSQSIFAPIGMTDTHFAIPPGDAIRQAKPLPTDPLTGAPQIVRDQTERRRFECGGGCLASTAMDYLLFSQMLLNEGTLDNAQVLGPKTVEFMTSNHTATGIDLTRLYDMAVEHADDHAFGLGVAVKLRSGGDTMGSPGRFHWAGSQGTAFWIDPEEELAIVYMAQTPGMMRRYYRQLIPALIYQSLTD